MLACQESSAGKVHAASMIHSLDRRMVVTTVLYTTSGAASSSREGNDFYCILALARFHPLSSSDKDEPLKPPLPPTEMKAVNEVFSPDPTVG